MAEMEDKNVLRRLWVRLEEGKCGLGKMGWVVGSKCSQQKAHRTSDEGVSERWKRMGEVVQLWDHCGEGDRAVMRSIRQACSRTVGSKVGGYP